MDTYFKDKTLNDLQDEKSVKEEVKPTFTKAMKDECVKYLRWQNGCIGEVDEKYVGKGDSQICSLVGIEKGQLDQFKADYNAKIAELTNPESIE